MRFISAALLLATGASIDAVSALQVGQKSTIHLTEANNQAQTETQKMWAAAVEAQKAPENANDLPFHFDLVGLAEGLSKTASTAVKVQKLSSHVREAKKTLEQHKRHVSEIEELVKKAEGDQQKELQSVLENAKKHVAELEQTVTKAEAEVEKEVKKEEQEKKDAAPVKNETVAVQTATETNLKAETELKVKELTEKLTSLQEKAKIREDKLKAIKNQKKLVKKQKELEKTRQQIAQVETELKEAQNTLNPPAPANATAPALATAKNARDQYSWQPVYENDEARYDAERKQRKDAINAHFDELARTKQEREKIKRQILDTKLETARVRTRHADPAPFSNPETNYHPGPDVKSIDARAYEMESLKNREKSAKDALKSLQDQNEALRSALEEAKEKLQETRKNVTEQIRKEWEEEQKKKKEAEQLLAQNELTAEKNQESVLRSQVESANKELKELKEKYDNLRSKHDFEVKELFENQHTLKFVKQMKHYKDEWWAKTGDEDRKKIATQMASTTKSWVSATKEQIEAEEKQQH